MPTEPRSRSEFVTVRGLRYHLRRWGDAAAPAVFLGHGWLDVSATFHHLALGLLPEFQVLAPDWRGFGHSQWPQDGYWFHDYVADLDALIDHYQPDAPVLLAGHSMGAQIASLYAGLRPSRVKKLVCLDGLFLPDMAPQNAPRRFTRWLDELKQPEKQSSYASYDDLAARIRKRHPRLSAERAMFVARCWGSEDGHGRIALCADPKHHRNSPSLYRAAESMAIWRQVTAPTLFIDAGQSAFGQVITPAQVQERRECFQQRQAVTLADAGHMLHFDAPEATAKLMAAFFADRPLPSS